MQSMGEIIVQAARLMVDAIPLLSEIVQLEQSNDLGRLVHLVDRIVHRRDQVLDVAAIERGYEAFSQAGHHLARDLVRDQS
jgi:hypothetical protein